MSRKKNEDVQSIDSELVGIRFSGDDLTLLRHVEETVSSKLGGLKVTRSTLVKQAVMKGLAELEASL